MRTLILALLSFGLPLFAAVAEASVPTEKHWNVEGVDRVALIYAPATAPTAQTPVIFAFHGHGGTMRYAAQTYGYQRLWPEAIVVYMQGLPTPGALTDPEGKWNGWQSRAGDQGDRDLKFFDAVLASLKQQYPVDAKRIFATGHSNGGGFTYLLWAERGDTFAAVAPAAAIAFRVLPRLKPKPVIHIAGERDLLVRFAWQQQTMWSIRKLNDCELEGKPWAKSGDLVGTLYPSKSGTPFVSVTYPGGHMFPREAPALIVQFFKEQSAAKVGGAGLPHVPQHSN